MSRKAPLDLFQNSYSALLPAFSELEAYLVESRGCVAYVKTMYVGFDLGGQMVASVHPSKGLLLEVALALPEDHPSSLLFDASHLKWRTLPVGVEVRTKADWKTVKPLLVEACDRIEAGEHDVQLENSRFSTGRGFQI